MGEGRHVTPLYFPVDRAQRAYRALEIAFRYSAIGRLISSPQNGEKSMIGAKRHKKSPLSLVALRMAGLLYFNVIPYMRPYRQPKDSL